LEPPATGKRHSLQRLKTAVACDLTAEQCLGLEAHLREVVASRAAETSLAERTRQMTEAGLRNGVRFSLSGVGCALIRRR
jgi:hypothetical protein